MASQEKEKQKEKASGTWMHPTEKHAQKKRERVDYSDETPQQQFGKMSLHTSTNPSNASANLNSEMNPNLSNQNQTYLLQNNLAFAAQLQNQQNPVRGNCIKPVGVMIEGTLALQPIRTFQD